MKSYVIKVQKNEQESLEVTLEDFFKLCCIKVLQDHVIEPMFKNVFGYPYEKIEVKEAETKEEKPALGITEEEFLKAFNKK